MYSFIIPGSKSTGSAVHVFLCGPIFGMDVLIRFYNLSSGRGRSIRIRMSVIYISPGGEAQHIRHT